MHLPLHLHMKLLLCTQHAHTQHPLLFTVVAMHLHLNESCCMIAHQAHTEHMHRRDNEHGVKDGVKDGV